MASSTGDRSRSLRAEINVTPLVDVVLVLLIIFMVITPLLRGKAVQLPAATSASHAAESLEPIVLTITPDKQLWIESRAIAGADLAAELSRRASANGRRPLVIKADASLSMRDLRPLLQSIKATGLEQIAFAVVEPPGAKAAP